MFPNAWSQSDKIQSLKQELVSTILTKKKVSLKNAVSMKSENCLHNILILQMPTITKKQVFQGKPVLIQSNQILSQTTNTQQKHNKGVLAKAEDARSLRFPGARDCEFPQSLKASLIFLNVFLIFLIFFCINKKPKPNTLLCSIKTNKQKTNKKVVIHQYSSKQL